MRKKAALFLHFAFITCCWGQTTTGVEQNTWRAGLHLHLGEHVLERQIHGGISYRFSKRFELDLTYGYHPQIRRRGGCWFRSPFQLRKGFLAGVSINIYPNKPQFFYTVQAFYRDITYLGLIMDAGCIGGSNTSEYEEWNAYFEDRGVKLFVNHFLPVFNEQFASSVYGGIGIRLRDGSYHKYLTGHYDSRIPTSEWHHEKEWFPSIHVGIRIGLYHKKLPGPWQYDAD